MKTSENPRHFRVDQRTYSATAVRAINQAIMFGISIRCVVLYPILQRMTVYLAVRTIAKLVNKIVVCFTRYSFFDTLDKTLTKIPINNFKSFVSCKNEQDLIKAFKSKRDYVRICKILARISRYFALGREMTTK